MLLKYLEISSHFSRYLLRHLIHMKRKLIPLNGAARRDINDADQKRANEEWRVYMRTLLDLAQSGEGWCVEVLLISV